MSNKLGNKIKNRKKPNDVIYTPKSVAKIMIEICNIKPDDKVLDPSKGAGVFYDNLPECSKDWCEIDKGRDFFDYNKEVTCIIGNAPYSLWDKWIDKTVELNPDRFCYIFGALNLTPKRLKKIFNKGYIVKKLHLFQVDWWFGSQYIVYFKKGNSIENILDVSDSFVCDICGKKCKRGRNGNSPNECSEKK
tara:strand:- start:170 stop:742 length:573 start_codon:yes stop_codon:yes gene_type:complete